MIEPIDQIFLGALMTIVGLFGFMILADELRNHPKVKYYWLAFWCGPPIIKLWFVAILSFIL